MDTRVQDYLDDKLQSAADLETLDALLADVKAQQDLLKKQLETARRDHEAAENEAQQHRAATKSQAEAFQAEQADIDRRLLLVTQSEASDEAVERFEASIERLRKLDLAAGYVELLTEVDKLRTQSIAALETSIDAALEPFRKLQSLVSSLRPLQEAAEGAAPHLVDHIVAVVQELRRLIQKAASDNLTGTVKKIHWPKLTDTIPLALQEEWSVNVGRLLDLQKQDLISGEHDSARPRDSSTDPAPLLALEVLVHDLEQRFTYHFSGNKPTNRLDKPEYFLNHVIDLIANYSDFVEDNFQPVLFRHFRGTDLASTPAYIDATCALITALLPMVKQKLYSFATQLAKQPPLLSHLVQEVIKFDVTLQESYNYAPVSPSTLWPGLSHFFLDTCGYFEQWLAAEREFALSRYSAIIEASDAGELDYDAVNADAAKPTKAAIRVNDLLETVTERYRHLSSFSQKIRFLMDVQIQIFDQYFQRLRSGLEAFVAMTSTVGRTMHTLTREEATEVQGVKGLDRLCRIFGSAAFLESAMRDWSDDVFFLELWAELDYRAKHRSGDTGTLKSNWIEIQRKTSSTIGTDNNGDRTDTGIPEGALFDETASSYRRIRTRSEAVLIDRIRDHLRQALKPYAAISSWASLSVVAGSATSAELDPALALLTDYLGFLRPALGRAAMRRVTRQVCQAVAGALWDGVLARSGVSFSTAGAAQFAADVSALCAAVDRQAGAGQAQAGMRRLLDGVTLLGLPVRGEIPRVQAGAEAGDDDAAAWDEEMADEDAEKEMPEHGLSLFQAERMIFQDNEGARRALEILGLESLSEADARTVLGKRVELAS